MQRLVKNIWKKFNKLMIKIIKLMKKNLKRKNFNYKLMLKRLNNNINKTMSKKQYKKRQKMIFHKFNKIRHN